MTDVSPTLALTVATMMVLVLVLRLYQGKDARVQCPLCFTFARARRALPMARARAQTASASAGTSARLLTRTGQHGCKVRVRRSRTQQTRPLSPERCSGGATRDRCIGLPSCSPTAPPWTGRARPRSEEHTSELQSREK